MTVAVVGAGLAGLRTCEALRQQGCADRIVLLGAEEHPPYTRPPLSKEVLRGEAEPVAARLRTDDELAALKVDLRLGVAATDLDLAARRVHVSDGVDVDADHVVIATGAAPRRLPGAAVDGVHVLRTVDDCLALRTDLDPGVRLVVIGAGFIGLEVAASARAVGCAVTVVDVLPAPLARVLPEPVGAAVRALHEGNGVTFRFGVGVTEIAGTSRVSAVRLSDGTELAADVVVVGIGVVPAVEWLTGSGLTVDDGVVCDESLQAAPGVWAVGDVARWRLPPASTFRLEHWTNATEQAQAVARSIVTGIRTPFAPVPYFWSDQYDAKLQSLGFTAPGNETHLVHGAMDEPRWVALLHLGDRLTGVVGLRAPGRVMKLRPLLAGGASFADAVAACAG